MKIDLSKESTNLKEFIAQFDAEMFLGFISDVLPFIASNKPKETLKNLSSPMRQLFYLMALNLTSDPNKANTDQPSNDDWEEIKSLLLRIENGYVELFTNWDDESLTLDEFKKRNISVSSFLSYFNQGPLNFEEQEIEKIREFYSPYNELPEIIETYTDTWGKMVKLSILKEYASSTNETESILTLSPDFEQIEVADIITIQDKNESSKSAYDESYHLVGTNEKFVEIYQKLKAILIEKIPGVIFNPQRYYISFRPDPLPTTIPLFPPYNLQLFKNITIQMTSSCKNCRHLNILKVE